MYPAWVFAHSALYSWARSVLLSGNLVHYLDVLASLHMSFTPSRHYTVCPRVLHYVDCNVAATPE